MEISKAVGDQKNLIFQNSFFLMMKIFTRVQKIKWISYTNFSYFIIQTYIPKVIFMFPQVSKKLTSQKLFSLNSIKLYNWCSNKMPKIKSLEKNHLLISRQKTEWEFFLRLSDRNVPKKVLPLVHFEAPDWFTVFKR